MYDMKKIQKETTHWNSEDNAKSKRVHASLIMEMVEPEIQRIIENAFEEFFDKVKSLVPDTIPAQGGNDTRPI